MCILFAICYQMSIDSYLEDFYQSYVSREYVHIDHFSNIVPKASYLKSKYDHWL